LGGQTNAGRVLIPALFKGGGGPVWQHTVVSKRAVVSAGFWHFGKKFRLCHFCPRTGSLFRRVEFRPNSGKKIDYGS